MRSARPLLLPLLLLPCLGARAQQVDVFIVIGQSNAVGAGVAALLPAEFQLPERVRLLGTAARDRNTFGPELGLAERLAAGLPERTLAIVKHAASGTSLHGDWRPGRGEWDQQGFGAEFAQFRSVLARDLAALRAERLEPIVRGVVWVQGEADASVTAPADAAASYGERLAGFVRRVRSSVGCADLPFVIVQVLPRPAADMPQRDSIRAAQAAVAAAVPFTFLVPTDDITLRADEPGNTQPDDVVHFGSLGLLEIGRRAADLLLPLVKAAPAGAVNLFNGKDLTGWVVDGRADAARVVEGELRLAARTRLRGEATYGDFTLELEARGEFALLISPEALPAIGARRPAGVPLRIAAREWTRFRVTCTGGVLQLRDDERALQHERTPSRAPGHLWLLGETAESAVRQVRIAAAAVPEFAGSGDDGFVRVDAWPEALPRGTDGNLELAGKADPHWSTTTIAGDLDVVLDWRAAKGEGTLLALRLGDAPGLTVHLHGDGRANAAGGGPFVMSVDDSPGIGDGAWHRLRLQVTRSELQLAVDGRAPEPLPLPGIDWRGPVGLEALAGKVTVANVYTRARQSP
ncbi:MAG: hypothetical protein IT455_02025 [Planctomycetes bacterium]|nr:hypothetical protein [Planctomycetota bacterium]